MVALMRAALEAEGYGEIATVATGSAALEPAGDADLILLDQQLPDTTGIELLPRLLARPDPPSIIMVTGEERAELAAAALRLGAEDYLVKGPRLFQALPATVERARRNRMLRSTRMEVERDLVRAERLAAIGEMTVTLHHELNNPLMAALAEVDLMLDGPVPGEEIRTGLEETRSALLRIRDIIKRAGDMRRAEPTNYLPGLQMIDLAAATKPIATPQGRAVVFAPDEELSRTASLLLRHAGFSVERPATLAEAEGEAERLDTTLVVLSVAGSASDPLQGFRPGPARQYTLLALVPSDPAPARQAGADLVLTLPIDPVAFTGEVLAAMPKTG